MHDACTWSGAETVSELTCSAVGFANAPSREKAKGGMDNVASRSAQFTDERRQGIAMPLSRTMAMIWMAQIAATTAKEEAPVADNRDTAIETRKHRAWVRARAGAGGNPGYAGLRQGLVAIAVGRTRAHTADYDR